jgi:hypothetical protein
MKTKGEKMETDWMERKNKSKGETRKGKERKNKEGHIRGTKKGDITIGRLTTVCYSGTIANY